MRDEPFLNLFMGLRRNMRLMTRKFLKDEEDVSDVLQDAFCRLWERRDRIADNDEQAKALTVATVRNLCLDHLRREKHFVDIEDESVQKVPVVSEEEALERRDRFEQVRKIVDSRLTDLQRRVFELKEIEDLDTDEVARRLCLTPEAVRMHLSRARKTIRDCFRDRNL